MLLFLDPSISVSMCMLSLTLLFQCSCLCCHSLTLLFQCPCVCCHSLTALFKCPCLCCHSLTLLFQCLCLLKYVISFSSSYINRYCPFVVILSLLRNVLWVFLCKSSNGSEEKTCLFIKFFKWLDSRCD